MCWGMFYKDVEECGSYLHMSIYYKQKNLIVHDLNNVQHKQRMFFHEI